MHFTWQYCFIMCVCVSHMFSRIGIVVAILDSLRVGILVFEIIILLH
jgi:hypothetical protein